MESKLTILDDLVKFGAKTAIIDRDQAYSFADLAAESDRMSRALAAGRIEKGAVVALVADYSFQSIALFIALARNKNIIVPLTTKVDTEINERLVEAYVDIKAVFEGEDPQFIALGALREKHPLLQAIIAARASGLILFSSGSTGKPKAMVHDLDQMIATYTGKKPRDNNRMVVFLMFDHIGGINTLLNSLAIGSTIAIPESRDANQVCQLIERHRLNILPASPTFLNLILISEAYKKYDLSSLSLITYGTEPMSEVLLTKIKAVFPAIKLLQTFGTSETGIAKTTSKASDSIQLKIEDPHTQYRIVDGELWLKSKMQVLGYLNAPMNNFTADGWYKTGDLVEQQDDGFLKITGRIKEMINVGGQKVLPEEVENVLFQIPEVADCIVYGEKNAIMGQIVAADIVLKEEIANFEWKKAIRAFLKQHLDSYKIPAKLNLVSATHFSDRFKKIRRK